MKQEKVHSLSQWGRGEDGSSEVTGNDRITETGRDPGPLEGDRSHPPRCPSYIKLPGSSSINVRNGVVSRTTKRLVNVSVIETLGIPSTPIRPFPGE